MDISVEMAQADNVLSCYFETAQGETIRTDAYDIVEKHIPVGSNCTDICVINEVVYLDYLYNDVRYIVGYYSDGTVEKVARKLDGENVYYNRFLATWGG